MKLPTKLVPLAVLLVLTMTVLSGVAAGQTLQLPDGPGDVGSPAVDSVSIDPDDSTVTVGDTFTVDIVVAGAQDLEGFDLDMDFAPGVVQIQDVALGDMLEDADRDFVLLDDVDNGAGTAVISAFSTGDEAGPAGSGVLATVTLEAVAAGTSPLDLHDTTVWDPGEEDVAAPGDGEVEVREPGACDPARITDLTSNSPVELGEPMQFNATVTGDTPIDYDWDFGGAGSGTGLDTATPTWTYNATGDYVVTLTVENACGTDQETLNVTVGEDVCDPPEITSLTSNSPVEVGEAMQFNANVSGDTPITYDWDFGGAGSGTRLGSSAPTWTYSAKGDYVVTLEVENACGTDQETLNVTVEEAVCDPVVITNLVSDSPAELGEPVRFYALVDGDGPVTYDWDFGGAGTATGEETAFPSFTYDEIGEYTVSLHVENPCGEDDATLDVVVEMPCDLEILDLTSDSPALLGEPIHFTATVTGTAPIDYAWDFDGAGDATGEDTATPTFTYDALGTYQVTLTVENFCGTEEATLLVKVVEHEVVVKIVPATSTVRPDDTFTVDVVVEGAEDLAGYELSMDFDPAVVDVQDVVLGDFLGSTGRDTVLLGPDIFADTVDVAAISLGDEPGATGDGVLATVTLEAVAEGTSPLDLHDVTLYDTEGAPHDPTTVLDGTVVVSEEEPCTPVTITGLTSNSPVMLGEVMQFNATVQGSSPFTYTWDFGGAGTATGEDTATPTYVYDAAGTYTVMLEVENPCGEDDEMLVVEVEEEIAYTIFLPIVTKNHTP